MTALPTGEPGEVEAPAHELEIQNAPGDAIRGPFLRQELRSWLYSGRLQGDEQVRTVGGRFVPMGSLPDFAEVITLRDGLKGTGAVVRKSAVKAAEAPAKPTEPVRELPRVELSRAEKRRLPLVIAGAVFVGVAVLVGIYVAMNL